MAPENERATFGESNSLSWSPRGNLSWQRGRRSGGGQAFEVLNEISLGILSVHCSQATDTLSGRILPDFRDIILNTDFCLTSSQDDQPRGVLKNLNRVPGIQLLDRFLTLLDAFMHVKKDRLLHILVEEPVLSLAHCLVLPRGGTSLKYKSIGCGSLT